MHRWTRGTSSLVVHGGQSLSRQLDLSLVVGTERTGSDHAEAMGRVALELGDQAVFPLEVGLHRLARRCRCLRRAACSGRRSGRRDGTGRTRAGGPPPASRRFRLRAPGPAVPVSAASSGAANAASTPSGDVTTSSDARAARRPPGPGACETRARHRECGRGGTRHSARRRRPPRRPPSSQHREMLGVNARARPARRRPSDGRDQIPAARRRSASGRTNTSHPICASHERGHVRARAGVVPEHDARAAHRREDVGLLHELSARRGAKAARMCRSRIRPASARRSGRWSVRVVPPAIVELRPTSMRPTPGAIGHVARGRGRARARCAASTSGARRDWPCSSALAGQRPADRAVAQRGDRDWACRH